jgi:hypothetical protein
MILKGFSLCVVYSSSVPVLSFYSSTTLIINHTKNTIKSFVEPTIFGPITHGDHLWICNIVLTDNFEDGDEVEVVVDWGPEIIVKNIGVCREDANMNRDNIHSSKREGGPPNKINDLQILLKKLTTEENEYYFFIYFIEEISKVSF